MLDKLGLKKHQLLFYIVPIFLLKFLIVRYFLFEQINILETIWVETFYLLLIFVLLEFISNDRIKIITYIVINSILSILLIGLVLYFEYSGQVVSILMLSQLDQVGTVKESVLRLLNPLYIILFLDLIFVGIWKLKTKINLPVDQHHKNHLFLAVTIITSFAMVTASVVTNKNQLIANAAHVAETEGIFTYEIVTVIQNFSKPPELKLPPQKLQAKINELKQVDSMTTPKFNATLQGKNVIFIQLEAFQDFLINLKVDGQEITPFLNKLSSESLYFSNIYQQIAVGSTSDAEFISNTSLYPNPIEATTKEFGDRAIPSLPKLLQKEGYYTVTMHANDVEFWNRENLYPALGFEKWYDEEYFGEDEIIGIGLSDKIFFQKSHDVLKNLHNNGQLFYAQLVTLTSHHPFTLPEEQNSLQLPSTFDESIVGDYLKVAHYVDKQLEAFFEQLATDSLLENCVVVLYGDHQGLQENTLSIEDKALLNSFIGHDYNFIDQYNIPLLIYADDENITDHYDSVGGQIDILPTVANLIGLSLDDFIYFGQDLLNNENNLFGMRYYMPYGSFFYNDTVYMTQTSYADGTGYYIDTRKEIPTTINLSNKYARIMELLELNDQYLNSLPLRLD